MVLDRRSPSGAVNPICSFNLVDSHLQILSSSTFPAASSTVPFGCCHFHYLLAAQYSVASTSTRETTPLNSFVMSVVVQGSVCSQTRRETSARHATQAPAPPPSSSGVVISQLIYTPHHNVLDRLLAARLRIEVNDSSSTIFIRQALTSLLRRSTSQLPHLRSSSQSSVSLCPRLPTIASWRGNYTTTIRGDHLQPWPCLRLCRASVISLRGKGAFWSSRTWGCSVLTPQPHRPSSVFALSSTTELANFPSIGRLRYLSGDCRLFTL
jgi:hypothetical protein